MPKVTHRSQRLATTVTVDTVVKREAVDDTAPSAKQRQSITIKGDKYIMAFKKHKGHNQTDIHVHISNRGALGSVSTASGVHRQGQKQAENIVINNDNAGTTIDMSSRVSNEDSMNIIINN